MKIPFPIPEKWAIWIAVHFGIFVGMPDGDGGYITYDPEGKYSHRL